MKPKELLKDLEKGDRTMEFLESKEDGSPMDSLLTATEVAMCMQAAIPSEFARDIMRRQSQSMLREYLGR